MSELIVKGPWRLSDEVAGLLAKHVANTPTQTETEIIEAALRKYFKLKPKKGAYSDNFEWLWSRRPQRSGSDPKDRAYKAYCARISEGVSERDMAAGLSRYGAWCAATGKIGTENVLQMATFFGPSEHWANNWDLPKRIDSGMTKYRTVSQQLSDRSWAVDS